MNRILSIILVVCLCLASFGGVPSAAAFFVNTDTISGGTAQAGVLDLKLSEVGPATRSSTTDETQRDAVTDTFENPRYGLIPVENTLQVDNTKSSLPADQISLRVTYTESDRTVNLINVGPQTTARTLTLATFTYQGTNLLGTVVQDENGNDQYDVDDLTSGQTRTNLAALPGIQAGGTADIRIEITRNTGLIGGISEGGDGIDMELQIEGSATSFTDSDSSTSNTIRYA